MKVRAADRRKKKNNNNKITCGSSQLSGVLAVGGPFKSDGISWLQWAWHLCEEG